MAISQCVLHKFLELQMNSTPYLQPFKSLRLVPLAAAMLMSPLVIGAVALSFSAQGSSLIGKETAQSSSPALVVTATRLIAANTAGTGKPAKLVGANPDCKNAVC
jgi:hypothetical protein